MSALRDRAKAIQYHRSTLHGGSGGIRRSTTSRKRDRTGFKIAGSNYMLPPPLALEIHDALAAEKWKRFKRAPNSSPD